LNAVLIREEVLFIPVYYKIIQIITQTPLKEQEGGGASGGATAAEERKYSAAALKKRLEERNLMLQLTVPNPYSMFGR
jgi:hypothetical protein